MLKKTGQSVLEYTLLVTIIMGAIVATTFYLKRGVQGKWKDVVDSLGEQYDPTVMNSGLLYTVNVSANTVIRVSEERRFGNQIGVWTNRSDSTMSNEAKTGYTRTGGY